MTGRERNTQRGQRIADALNALQYDACNGQESDAAAKALAKEVAWFIFYLGDDVTFVRAFDRELTRLRKKR